MALESQARCCGGGPRIQGRTAVPRRYRLYAQQAAEKSFKGFLTWHSTPFRKTHNLEELGEQCLAIDPSLMAVIDLATPLTKYSWKYRYPGELAEPVHAEAAEALSRARDVLEAILVRLPREVRS